MDANTDRAENHKKIKLKALRSAAIWNVSQENKKKQRFH